MWEISDFSTTNIQKLWVDEPELLKSNGKYLFYYSEVDYDDQYVSIIKTPTKKDLSDAEVLAKIKACPACENNQYNQIYLKYQGVAVELLKEIG